MTNRPRRDIRQAGDAESTMGGEPAAVDFGNTWDRAEHRRRLTTERRERACDLLEPEAFSNAEATDDDQRRFGRSRDPRDSRAQSLAVHIRLARSCAGWGTPPTSEEFYRAVRAEKPDRRQAAILRVWVTEGDWQELIQGWAERAYTLRQLVGSLHRAGLRRCRAARVLNGWAER